MWGAAGAWGRRAAPRTRHPRVAGPWGRGSMPGVRVSSRCSPAPRPRSQSHSGCCDEKSGRRRAAWSPRDGGSRPGKGRAGRSTAGNHHACAVGHRRPCPWRSRLHNISCNKIWSIELLRPVWFAAPHNHGSAPTFYPPPEPHERSSHAHCFSAPRRHGNHGVPRCHGSSRGCDARM